MGRSWSPRVSVTCPHCGCPMVRTERALEQKTLRFCSKVCANVGRQQRIQIPCHTCGTLIIRTPSEIARSTHAFCSKACKKVGLSGARQPLAETFWDKVDLSGGPDACWPWLGYCNIDGYGMCAIPGESGKTEGTHRIAFRLTFGPFPDDLQIRHKVCSNPPCCNPAHLAVGTHLDNMQDKVAIGHQNLGEKHPLAKLTDEDARQIFALKGKMPRRDIAALFHISPPIISQIHHKRLWKHIHNE